MATEDVKLQECSRCKLSKAITNFCAIATAVAAISSLYAAKKANEISQRAIEYQKEQDQAEMEEKIRPVLRFQKEYAVFTIAADELETNLVRTKRGRKFGDLIVRNFGNGPAIKCHLDWTIYNAETNKLLAKNFQTKLPFVDIAGDEEISVIVLPRKLFDEARTKGSLTIRCKDKDRNEVSSVYEFSSSWIKDGGQIELNMLLIERPILNTRIL